MDWLEKIIQNRFKNAQSSEGIDADALWQNIAKSKVVGEPISITSTTSIATSKIIIATTFSALLLSVGVYWATTNKTAITQKNNALVKVESSTINWLSITSYQVNEHSSTAPQSLTLTTPVLQSSTKVNSRQPLSIEKNQLYSEYKTPKIAQQKVIPPSTVSNAKTLENKVIPVKEIDDLKNETIAKTETITKTAISDPSNRNITEFPLLASLPNPIIPHSTTPIINTSPPTNLIRPKKSFRFAPSSLSLYGGVNTFQHAFENEMENSSLSQGLNRAFNQEVGGQIGISANWRLGKLWDLSMGVEWVQVENQLSKQVVKDTMVYRTNRSFGLVEAQEVRTIQHHNRLQFLSIPIELSIHQSFRAFDIGLGVGISYSFIRSQSGKVFNADDEILEYGSQSSAEIFERNFLSLRLNPYVGYRLSKRLGLRMNVLMSRQRQGMTSLLNLNHRSTLIAPSLGISYQLR